jgi:hypothetical protein
MIQATPQKHAPMPFRVRVTRRARLVSETPCRTFGIAQILARKAKAEQPAGAAVEIRRGRDLVELYR